ncbi:F-box/LRR-repeat protein 20 [Stylophora pistillata]|uniref:F-box/LRR-repeat protein 20 n=1 Tax=Stylophora pistillata TaxID=50429 RepID=A0A2B4RDK3_STYPI|nr:F-box/LRR-repeat protein 20 [Stylophora pistillata]
MDLEGFEELASFSHPEIDNSDDKFEDEDIEEIIFLEELTNQQFLGQTVLKQRGENTCPFDILPEEIILKIFSFFTLGELCGHVALVCKMWLHYSRCPLLRQKLSFWDRSIESSLVEISDIIKSNFPLLRDLCLQPKMDLTLHGCRLLAQSCPHLQKLSLSFCSQVNKSIIDQFVTFCPKLRDLNLAGCGVTDQCLDGLNKVPLRRLNASHCTKLTDDGLKFLSTECYQLCHINFDGIQWITHDAITVLVEKCYRRLECFGLSFCTSLTDQALEGVQNMKNLVSLTLKKGTEFSAKALKELFEHLHPQNSGSATGLLHVSVAECTNLNDEAVNALADSCRNLQSIDISWCWEVTDAGLERVINSCHQMLDMNICGAKDFRGNPLKKIPQQMSRLRRLDATQCNLVPDELLDELVSIMPQMTVINYYGEEVYPLKYIDGSHIIKDGTWCT